MFGEKKILIKMVILFAFLFILSSCTPPHCSTDFLILAINNANSNPGLDTIDLAPGCVYELDVVDNTIDGNNGLPSITTPIVINGHDATVRRGTGAQKSAIRLFHVSQSGDLVLNDITLLDGIAIEPTDVTLLLPNSGGAVLNRGDLTVNNSLITANKAKLKGGGIYNEGTMTINQTTIQNNEANIGNVPNESGGGILNTGTATINDSTISNNIASQAAGGIGNTGDLVITNSTVSGNSTTISGIVSGAAILNAGNATISYTTIANNVGTTSGAVWSTIDTIEIHNSIVAYNLPSDCSYPATSMILGPNIGADGSCDGMVTDDPLLDPLANNGGPTETHAIAASSPARDFAFGLCPAADQRGEPRPHGSACDIGSYEFSGGGGPPGDSSILTGLVFDDVNADGIHDPGEPGFAGVELVLETGPCLAPVSSTTELTAPDGTFQFEILPPTAGTYCLSIDPLIPPNDTILIPGGFIVPVGGEMEITLTEGEDLSDLLFAWDFQFAGSDLAPNPIITNVVLSTTTPPAGGFVEVEVTVENQGAYPAEDYELVLIPHYGVGPPNPAGYVTLPDLLPGVPHTEVFSPGVLYSSAGTHTLRVLVTDDWYALGDPDSTGTNGDFQDYTITVLPTFSFCNPFEGMELSLVLLKIRPDTLTLPLYLKTEGAKFPDQADVDGGNTWKFYATLGGVESFSTDSQGFEDRKYFMFKITPDMAGTAANLLVYVEGCDDEVFELIVMIPEMSVEDETPTCKESLSKEDCEAAGGKMSTGATRAPYCICP